MTLNGIANTIIIICSALTAILAVIEKSSKISAKPLSKFFHGDLDKKIDDLHRTVDENDIDAVRNRIIANESMLKAGEIFERHQWESLYKDIDKWNAYHQKYPELNGIIRVAIENIDEFYKKQSR